MRFGGALEVGVSSCTEETHTQKERKKGIHRLQRTRTKYKGERRRMHTEQERVNTDAYKWGALQNDAYRRRRRRG